MSRCIFCKHCPTKWYYDFDSYDYNGTCIKEKLPLDYAIMDKEIQLNCSTYEPRPQHEIYTITKALKMIGINLEE